MTNLWNEKTPKNCRNCGVKIEGVFYDGTMAACEGFARGQFCEKCFEASKMLGRAKGMRYSRNEKGVYISD